MKRSYYWLLLLAFLPPVALAPFVFPAGKPLVGSTMFSTEDTPLLPQDPNHLEDVARATNKNIHWPNSETINKITGNGSYILTDRIDPIYWIAGRVEGNGSARFESQRFRAPRWISLAVTGDLTRPGNDVYFQLDGTNRRFPVRVRTEELFWRRVSYTLPSDWVGKPIRLMVQAGPRAADNWFGFSSPRELGAGTVVAQQLRAVAVLPGFVVALALFLLPGLPLAMSWVARDGVGPAFLLPLAILFSSLAGYAAFWVYFLNPTAGRWFGGVLYLGTAAWFVAQVSLRPAVRSLIRSAAVTLPLALMALVGLFYLAVTFAFDLEVISEAQTSMRFFEFTLAIDKDIPFFFADPIYNGRDVRPEFPTHVPGWHTSDRPPLQTGLILLQLPVGYWLGEPRVYSSLVACALQCVWVSAAWLLWTVGGLPRRPMGLAFLLVAASGFAFINTVFTWPKMLSAGLCLFAITIALVDRPPGERLPWSKALLFGLGAGLAFLGHGGVAFTLLPFGLLLLLPRWYPGWTRLALAGAVFVGLYYPWTLYQKLWDPPGDKLVRLHLAGNGEEKDTDTWQSGRPLWRNLLAAYQATNIHDVINNRLANLKVLFVPAADQYPWPTKATAATWPDSWTGYRRCDFLALFWSLGLLNVGWLAPRVRAWRPRQPLHPILGVVVPGLALASVLVWVVLMFGPGSTVIHQGSYATFLLFFVYLAARVSQVPGRLPYLLLIAQGMLFVVAWLLTSPAFDFGLLNPFMIVLAAVLAVPLIRVALGPPPVQTVAVKTKG